MSQRMLLRVLLAGAALAWQVPALSADAPQTDKEAVFAVVEDFHHALEEGYREGVLNVLDEKVVIFETGFIEASRAQYAEGHLDADLLFSAQVRRSVVHHIVDVAGDMAVVLTQSRSDGEFQGRPVHLENTETVVLHKGGEQWKITHIHWSAHDRSPDSK